MRALQAHNNPIMARYKAHSNAIIAPTMAEYPMLSWLASLLNWVNILDTQGDLFLDEVFLLQVFLFSF